VSRSAIPRALRDAVFERDRGRCQYCGLSQFGHGATFHINHVVPRSKGGATAIENLVLQCPNCSLHKADRVTAVDPIGGLAVPLLHPLRDAWSEHIRVECDGSCAGLSAVGRATVSALGMNDPIPRLARLCQLALGIIRPGSP
jgi:hypothetical protein